MSTKQSYRKQTHTCIQSWLPSTMLCRTTTFHRVWLSVFFLSFFMFVVVVVFSSFYTHTCLHTRCTPHTYLYAPVATTTRNHFFYTHFCMCIKMERMLSDYFTLRWIQKTKASNNCGLKKRANSILLHLFDFHEISDTNM